MPDDMSDDMSRDSRGRRPDPSKQPGCLRCYHVRTRIFRNEEDLQVWCDEKEIHLKPVWLKYLQSDKILRLFWCSQARKYHPKRETKPRLTLNTANPKPFIKNCPFLTDRD